MSSYGEDEVVDDFDDKRIAKAVVTAEKKAAQLKKLGHGVCSELVERCNAVVQRTH